MRRMEYGSEYDFQANAEFICPGDSGFVKPDWQLYRSGRDAIKALARVAGRKKALLPALCCESMVLPFTQNGYEVSFYRLDESLGGCEADVLKKLEKGCVFVYMRYYGIPAFSDGFLESLRGRGEELLLVEDRTHDILIPRERGGFEPDATLASLRKWAALPDGGMLKTALGAGGGVGDGRFASMRHAAMEKKSRYLETWDAELKKEFLSELNAAAGILDESGQPVKMGAAEERLLRSMDFEKLAARRMENALLLRRLLLPLEERGLLRFVTESPESSTLYLPLFLENNRAVQAAMAKKDIYCAVLWPTPPGAEGVCPVADYVTGHTLGIPCDQRYDAQDMRFIAGALTEILTEN